MNLYMITYGSSGYHVLAKTISDAETKFKNWLMKENNESLKHEYLDSIKLVAGEELNYRKLIL